MNKVFPPSWRGDLVHSHACATAAVIGDIHGRDDLLLPLLAQLDRPIFVTGDICDRGLGTPRCIDALIERGATGVLGNHDLWFARWSAGGGFLAYALQPTMGGRSTLASYRARPADWERVPRAHSEWVNRLNLVLDLTVADQKYWLVHAGFPLDRPLKDCTLRTVLPVLARDYPEDLLWRKNTPEHMIPLDRPVVMGHVEQPAPLRTQAGFAIDTGAGGSYGRLTALLLPEEEFITVGPTLRGT